MSAFIRKELRYPNEALEAKIEGTVVVRAAIDYKGKVIQTQVKSSVGHGCDKEAERVVALLEFEVDMPRRGKILFHKTLNINFRLPKKKSKAPVKPVGQSSVQLRYEVTKKKKGAPPSYSYTITL